MSGAEEPTRSHSPAAILLRYRELAVIIAIALLLVVTTMKSSQFTFSPTGWRDLLLSPAILILLAVGQTVVIVTRNIDISVGSILGLTAYLAGTLLRDFPSLPIMAVVLIAVAAGGLLGLVNGILVAWGKAPAMVITLGTMYIYRAVLLTWAGSTRINADDMPAQFLALGVHSVLGIPTLMIVALVVLCLVGYYMQTARTGRELYALGSDPAAAVLYGIATKKRVMFAFVISGLLAGTAGAMYAARFGTISSGAGNAIEMQAIGAAVIGGVAIFGGSGTVWGAALGAFLLTTINRALPVLGISSFWQQAMVGLLVIVAIVLDRILADRQERRLVAERDQSPASNDPAATARPTDRAVEGSER
jgi:rhamnose transport system permease protein